MKKYLHLNEKELENLVIRIGHIVYENIIDGKVSKQEDEERIVKEEFRNLLKTYGVDGIWLDDSPTGEHIDNEEDFYYCEYRSWGDIAIDWDLIDEILMQIEKYGVWSDEIKLNQHETALLEALGYRVKEERIDDDLFPRVSTIVME